MQHSDLSELTGSEGLGFQQRETQEFRRFSEQLADYSRNALERSYPQLAKALLTELEADTTLYVRRLYFNNGKESTYYKTPILKYIPIENFVSTLWKLQIPDLRLALSVFRDRYDKSNFRPALETELPWLNDLKEELQSSLNILLPFTRATVANSVKYVIEPILADERSVHVLTTEKFGGEQVFEEGLSSTGTERNEAIEKPDA